MTSLGLSSYILGKTNLPLLASGIIELWLELDKIGKGIWVMFQRLAL